MTMTACLRELAERMSQLRTYIANAPDVNFGIGSDRSSGYVRNYSVRDNLLCMIDAINSILDAECARTLPEKYFTTTEPVAQGESNWKHRALLAEAKLEMTHQSKDLM